ncbi:hypothetical protein [Streptomyces sp. NPDC088360]|uniref:hypothetical protein n=1 Tax=Streptomyces sp. NPDC088360 TaxID=3154515 RepID=UPI00344DEABE
MHAYLVCTLHTLILPQSADSLRVESPTTEKQFTELDAALAEAFGGVFTPSAQGAARLRRTQQSG